MLQIRRGLPVIFYIAGLYFEFLPYTQEQGGLEQLGLSICQMEPERAAQDIRGQLPD